MGSVFESAFQEWAGKADVQPGRVLIEFNYICRVWCDGGEIEAVRSGRLSHRATSRSELPAVGDWVVVRKRPDEDRGAIVAVLPRRSWFSRRMAGHVTDEQVVAANVDVVFIVMALDDDFSPRRLERYLLMARESGAAPVVLLTKPDVCDDVPARVAEVAVVDWRRAGPRPQPETRSGPRHRLRAYLPAGKTGALLGSSGVGKSTIINRLVGRDVQKTQGHPRVRLEGAAHDDASRARVPAQRRVHDRHARDARAAAVGCRASASARRSTTSKRWRRTAGSPIAAIATSRAAP